MNDDDSCAGRRAAADCRPAAVRSRGSSVSSRWWEVSERAGRRGRRSAGGRRHARAGSVTAPSPPRPSAGRSASPRAPDSLRDACRSPGQQLRQLLHVLDLLQEILHVGAPDRTVLEPARDPPVEGGGRFFEMLGHRGLEVRLLVEQRPPQTGERAGACQSGSRYTGSDGTSQPRYTARMTPRSSTSLRSHRSGTRSWWPFGLGVSQAATS